MARRKNLKTQLVSTLTVTKTLFKSEDFENAGFAFQCGRKTFYVTINVWFPCPSFFSNTEYKRDRWLYELTHPWARNVLCCMNTTPMMHYWRCTQRSNKQIFNEITHILITHILSSLKVTLISFISISGLYFCEFEIGITSV